MGMRLLLNTCWTRGERAQPSPCWRRKFHSISIILNQISFFLCEAQCIVTRHYIITMSPAGRGDLEAALRPVPLGRRQRSAATGAPADG